MSVPTLVAHRGHALRYPENTLPALEAALQAGARWVELDVQLSADGVPHLFHDRTLQRLCGVKGALHELDAAAIAELACAQRDTFGERFAGVRVARLDQLPGLLAAHPGASAFVEVKRVALERFGQERVLRAVLEALGDARTRCVMISFALDFLEWARPRAGLRLGAVIDHWSERAQPALARLAPEFLFCDVEGIPPAGSLAHAGARTAFYEVADPSLARALAARGAELVETFAIAEMLAALGPEGGA